MSLSVHCPLCGGTDIREKNTAVANLKVLSWEWDDEAAEVRPADYDADESADWETADDATPYVCYSIKAPHGRTWEGRCKWEGRLIDLAVRGGLR